MSWSFVTQHNESARKVIYKEYPDLRGLKRGEHFMNNATASLCFILLTFCLPVKGKCGAVE
jgi:hypothetical protein